MAEERTLKAAAVKIGQTPSAISQNIKALENFLGVTLFERDSRPILLTKAGRRLFALARELLQKNDEILEAVRSE
ncbi:LysR family transcriptional regulator, partial [Parasutterella excrementihominis]|uniref:LysR family transcriptional regulator n=1 Tax=Parasutterella excrementihominis TaxID=487175 RepID=UPI003AB261B1